MTVPAGATTGAGTLALRNFTVPAAALSGVPEAAMTVIGPGIQVTLSGPTLTGTARVTFHLPDDAASATDPTTYRPDGSTTPSASGSAGATAPYVVFWQDGNGGWQWLATTPSSDGRTVTAQAHHFSGGFLARVNVPAWAKSAAQGFVRYLSGRSGVKAPSCGDEKGARAAGIAVVSDRGDSVRWCLGLLKGQLVLKVANNRRTFTQVTYPRGWKVLDGASYGLSDDALARSLGSWVASAPRGYATRVIDGGDTLVLAIPAGTGGQVRAEMGWLSWLVSSLVLAADVYFTVFEKAGLVAGGGGKATTGRLLSALSGHGGDGYVEALNGCVDELRNAMPGKVNASGEDLGWGAVKAWGGCLPELMKADPVVNGAKLALLGAYVSAVAAVVSAVLTAANLIVTATRDLYDNIASFAGHSDPIYDILVTVHAPAPDPLAALAAAGRATCQKNNPHVDPTDCTRPPGARISHVDPRYGFSGPYAEGYSGSVFKRSSATSADWKPVFASGGGATPCAASHPVPESVLRDLDYCY